MTDPNPTTFPPLPDLTVAQAEQVVLLLDHLGNAIAHRDGDRAVRVINALYAAAGNEWTDALVEHLLLCGLRRLAARGGGSR
jgi:hypothetical protein